MLRKAGRAVPVAAVRACWIILLVLGCLGGRMPVWGATPNEVGSAPFSEQRIAPWLQDRLAAGGDEEMLILLDDRPDLSSADGLASRTDKGRFVYDTLRASALGSQMPLVGWLKSQGLEPRQFWIVNAILVRGNISLAQQVAAMPEVARVVGNPQIQGLEEQNPFEIADPIMPLSSVVNKVAEFESTGGGAIESIEWGVNAVKAPDVWNLRGARGEGIVVASMDTGVEWTHPAIQTKYRGWNGGSPDHSYSWHDSTQHTTVPLDDNNHGTHTTGTMVGDDGLGNQIGVAPGARWIACRNMLNGVGTPARYLECLEWGLAPYPEGANPLMDGKPSLAADITNNSWTCPVSEGCDALSLRAAFESARAAGQMTVAAAGNSGPSCSSINAPPADHDAAFAVGAVDSTTTLAGFSSRGPVTADLSNRMKPNVAAPGVSVRSCVRGGLYSNSSGTSMASPHTAGSMALLWSAKPYLRHLIRISRCYMERSAGPVNAGGATACGGTGPGVTPNNLWGWGMINALAAVDFGPDWDGDQIADACDCAPGASSSFDAPPEVPNDKFTDKQTYAWGSLATLAGTGTLYDVVRGLVSQLAIDGGTSGASCQSDSQGGISYVDTHLPPAGDAYYYLVRGQNVCGQGTYGNSSTGPRSISACL